MNNKNHIGKSLTWILFLIVLIPAVSAIALQPEQILIVANGDNSISVSVAKYYSQKRSVPDENILMLELGSTLSDSISRIDYEKLIANPVRKKLSQNEFSGKIKCLLTVYGVHFKIAARGRNQEIATDDTLNKMKEIYRVKADRLRAIAVEVRSLSIAGDITSPKPTMELKVTKIQSEIKTEFDKSLNRIQAIKDSADKNSSMEKWLKFYTEVYGIGNASQKTRSFGREMKLSVSEQLALAEKIRFIKSADLENWNYDRRLKEKYYEMLESTSGLAGVLTKLDSGIDDINGVQTDASVDSELSMVMFYDYPLYRWQPNELAQRLLWIGTTTLMVSRLDGPGEQIAKTLVDKAMAAEEKGLDGRAYFDMRYATTASETLYQRYDNSLARAALVIEQRTHLKVTTDRNSSLFEPGRCPETALYCGWYSLKKYVDAFDFVDGAVGYHIASFEAVDLRSGTSLQWCPAMLRDGITATLGPVAEPYLMAFPKPDEFFTELVRGRCLAEAYYRTKPFNSWQMLLIGDPLYRPFTPN